MHRLLSSKTKGGPAPQRENSGRGSVRPSSLQYFYGRITREEAELFLQERGGSDGLYLLRESISPMGNYAVSICHKGRVHHYSIEKQVDGSYKIPEGRGFPGPVELLEHYQNHMDGFITQPARPCIRLIGQSPVAFRGITYHQLEKALHMEAKKLKCGLDTAFGSMRDNLVRRVAAGLHADMPWFHGKITRAEAEERMSRDGHGEGKFLIRQRDEKNTFALTLSCDSLPRHYFISQRQDERYAIEDGPRFDCLMMLVDNYHNKSDGLACKLRQPCCRPGYSSIDFEEYMIHNNDRRGSLTAEKIAAAGQAAQAAAANGSTPLDNRQSRRLPPIPGSDGSKSKRRDLPQPPSTNGGAFGSFAQDMTDALNEDPPEVQLGQDGEELEMVYGSVQLRTEVNTHTLQRDQVVLEDLKLGAGNFGSVMKGVCHLGDRDLPVAVKTLKNCDLEPGVQPELVKEAEVMKQMDHKHIVRMIGIVEGDPLMLVLELAALGPLHKYLVRNKQLRLWTVVQLMWQVAQGMEYLEARAFVHRDLAARNILLCDPHFAKISDFGMSKALSREDNYYQAERAGKWPLKWCALECINYWKFDSKSDVWSFGVTLWEAASYGAKPYHKMKAQEMVEFLVAGNRLAKPLSCTDDIYRVMQQCWKEDRQERLTFKELVPIMEDLCNSHRAAGI